jgi:FdhE protein
MTLNAAQNDGGQRGRASPDLIFADPARLFLERSRRFAALSEGHSLAGWLSFLGRLTRIQHEILQEYPALHRPDEGALAFAREHCLPPIAASSWPRDPSWRQALASLARTLVPHAPPPAQKTLKRIQTMDGAALEAIADRVLRVEFDGPDRDCLPFVAAALQVHWTTLAAGIEQRAVTPLDTQRVCPCCGFLPVAGVVRMDGEVAKLRYLHCGLCNTEWHLERVTCAACRDSNGVAYRYIEGSDGTVRAETCDACKSYLKMFYREKSPEADPVADDLATLALDMLVDEAGYDRMSPNLLFVPCRTTGLHGCDGSGVSEPGPTVHR